MNESLLREHAVCAQTGMKRSLLWLQVKSKLFVKPVRISTRAVAWPASEVASIVAARMVGMGEEDLRALVSSLEESRRLRAAAILARPAL